MEWQRTRSVPRNFTDGHVTGATPTAARTWVCSTRTAIAWSRTPRKLRNFTSARVTEGASQVATIAGRWRARATAGRQTTSGPQDFPSRLPVVTRDGDETTTTRLAE